MNNQILDEGDLGLHERIHAESFAIGMVSSKIRDKYDLPFEITPTLPFDITKQYRANDRIILDGAKEYDETSTYSTNDIVDKDGKYYIAIAPQISSPFDKGEWLMMGNKYDLYYIPLPYPLFQLNIQKQRGAYTAGFYNVGDVVWWDNHTYTCKVQTCIMDSDLAIQYPSYASLPSNNVFPNDVHNGSAYWTDNGEYILDAGLIPSLMGSGATPSVWKAGDNRDILLVQCIINIALYLLHKRIAPQNVPEHRKLCYKLSIEWLDSIKEGKDLSNLVPVQPNGDTSISWGSKVKLSNGY